MTPNTGTRRGEGGEGVRPYGLHTMYGVSCPARTNDAFASVRETDIFQKHEMSWAEQRVIMNEAIRMLLQANHPLGQVGAVRICPYLSCECVPAPRVCR